MKLKHQKHGFYSKGLSFGYSTTTSDHSNYNELYIIIFNHSLSLELPPFFKGKPDEYNELENNGFYFSVDNESIYYHQEINDYEYFRFEYPWNIDYVKDSRRFLDSYGHVIYGISTENYDIFEYHYLGDVSEMFKFYDIIDPYDGSKNQIKAFLQRATYHRGIGFLKPLMNMIFKPYYHYRVKIVFKDPFGARKNSWKGGTNNMSIPLPNFMHLNEAVKYATEKEGIKFCEEIFEN